MQTRYLSLAILLAAPAAVAGETILAESTFDAGPDGWAVPVSAGWDAGLGNPGGCLFGPISEPENITATAQAPAAFLGDWSALDGGAGELRFDFALLSLGPNPTCGIAPLSPRISGPGGSASWNGPQFSTPVPYTTYIATIDAAEWTMISGDWAALLADVASLAFQLELVCNSGGGEDQQALDNVRLVRLSGGCGPADFNTDGLLDFFDLQSFLQAFSTQQGSGDFNDDGVFDFFDLQLFLQSFAAGCP